MASASASQLTYDVHTHVGVDQAFWLAGWWPYGGTAQDLLERMDSGGIDRAVCFPMVVSSAFDSYAFADDRSLKLLPDRFPYDFENASLIREIKHLGATDRLLPLAMFDPARQVKQQVESIEKLVDSIAGLKTQTTVLQSPIRSLLGEGRPLMELAEAHNLPVLFHTAVAPDDKWAQVSDCADVAEAYPDIRFNLAHSLRFDREQLERVAKMPNVWVDCSAHLVHCHLATQDSPGIAPKSRRVDADYSNPTQVFEVIDEMLGGRYMWGSDTPFMSWCDDNIQFVCRYAQEVAALRAARPEVQQRMLTDAPQAWLTGN